MIRIILIALLVAPTSQAASSLPYLVAGYKALFTCSATFLARQTQDRIDELEFTGTIGDLQPLMANFKPAIDLKTHAVSVSYEKDKAPRIARLNEPLGCVLLPPSASPDMLLPHVDLPKAAKPEPWSIRKKSDVLDRLIKTAFDGKTYGELTRTSAVVVVQDGKIIGEHYSLGIAADTPGRTWSVAKSIMGVLVGVAAKDGLLEPNQETGLKIWSRPGDPRAKIRIIDLMRMSSGLDAGVAGNRTDEIYFGGGRVVDHSLTNELFARPNTRWFYSNNDTLALSYLLRERIHDDQKYLAYPYVKLFHRIGMLDTTAETDWDGTFVLSSQVWSTARDLAKFGMLLAQDGVWQGERILPEGWVKLMATPAPIQPKENPPESRGYGATIWLLGPKNGLPEGTMAALGNRGQFVVVIPQKKLVIVRRGFDIDKKPFSMAKFAADAFKAIY